MQGTERLAGIGQQGKPDGRLADEVRRGKAVEGVVSPHVVDALDDHRTGRSGGCGHRRRPRREAPLRPQHALPHQRPGEVSETAIGV